MLLVCFLLRLRSDYGDKILAKFMMSFSPVDLGLHLQTLPILLFLFSSEMEEAVYLHHSYLNETEVDYFRQCLEISLRETGIIGSDDHLADTQVSQRHILKDTSPHLLRSSRTNRKFSRPRHQDSYAETKKTHQTKQVRQAS